MDSVGSLYDAAPEVLYSLRIPLWFGIECSKDFVDDAEYDVVVKEVDGVLCAPGSGTPTRGISFFAPKDGCPKFWVPTLRTLIQLNKDERIEGFRLVLSRDNPYFRHYTLFPVEQVTLQRMRDIVDTLPKASIESSAEDRVPTYLHDSTAFVLYSILSFLNGQVLDDNPLCRKLSTHDYWLLLVYKFILYYESDSIASKWQSIDDGSLLKLVCVGLKDGHKLRVLEFDSLKNIGTAEDVYLEVKRITQDPDLPEYEWK